MFSITDCKIKSEWIPGRTDIDREDWHGANHYRLVLRYDGRQMTCFYSMGSALTEEPTIFDVLESLMLDASAIDAGSFEDWAADFGYDTDSRQAERTYRACVKSGQKLRRLLGSDFDRMARAIEARS